MKLYDCFLFNDETALLEIRLRLLGEFVDYFVIVQSAETFTGRPSKLNFPTTGELIDRYGKKIRLITLKSLSGNGAWAREEYSRNAISQGLYDAEGADLIMVSDVDELPRPEVLLNLKRNGINLPVSLLLDYFNFKFNYKLIHGLQALWAGPVIVSASAFPGGQALRNIRWANLGRPDGCIRNAGWHFSYLTASDDISTKLESFSHQEREIQSRKDRVLDMINARQGFHDHINPGSVWAVIPLSGLESESLSKLLDGFPELIFGGLADSPAEIDYKIKLAVHRMCYSEQMKTIRFYSWRELINEIGRRLIRNVRSWQK